jgi:hypothetical protein
LPNGNILVCEGREAFFFELDTNNNIVWEYASPISNADGTTYEQGTEIPPNNFAFRATKYGTDYEEFSLTDLSVYPNPTKDFINIESTMSIDKIEIYNISGSKIVEKRNSQRINLTNLERGVYFLKAYSNGNTVSKKILKQ